jgi:hypothetical protein
LTIEEFRQENGALMFKHRTHHWALSYGPDNRLIRRPPAKFNPAWFPAPQETRPSKKHMVSMGDSHGIIVYVDHGQEEVGVLFFDTGMEAIDLGCFYSHTSKGGKTRWILDV